MSLPTLWADVGFTPNPAQEQAIGHVAGPLYLPAGPGSGKTRVLLWRTVNLIVFHGVKPDEIFLSTFTEKAALQLKEGLRGLLAIASRHTDQHYDMAGLYVGTVHALCRRLLLDRRLHPQRQRATGCRKNARTRRPWLKRLSAIPSSTPPAFSIRTTASA